MGGGKCKACGSTTHVRSTHRECPYNKKRSCDAPTAPPEDDDSASDDSQSGVSLDESDDSPMSADDWCYEDDIISGGICLCGAGGRAHKKDCPMSSRNRYPSCALSNQADENKLTNSAKRKRQDVDDTPVTKKCKTTTSSFKPGDHVYLHSNNMTNCHVPCRVVQSVDGKHWYQVYCRAGILNRHYTSEELTASSIAHSLSLERWRQAPKIALRDLANDSSCLEQCTCNLSKSTQEVIVLSDDSDVDPAKDNRWLHNQLFSLTHDEKVLVTSSSGWLNDNIISAAQLIMLQHFPHMSGLQPPTLQQTMAFDVHRGEFVQILHVHNSHWCAVSNVGCDDGVVNYYDSLYPSVSSATMRTIASLLFSPASELVVNVMGVQRQSNSSDCGVFAIAFVFDICSGHDPCTARYDQKSLKKHLAKCLEDCKFTRFPTLGERKSSQIKRIQKEQLHCSCRLPENKGIDEMAECDSCKLWYHRHCMDIPSEVFSGKDVPWKCKKCECQ